MKITSKIATVTLLALATNMSVFAMTRNDFDNGMAKGINYFNQGLYYEAKDEFQWFCDANWGSMNAGQQKYALDYLGGAKARIQKWEQSLKNPSGNDSLLMNYAAKIDKITNYDINVNYYNVRFMLADVTGDETNELLAIGLDQDGQMAQIEVFINTNGNVKSIMNSHCSGYSGGYVLPVKYDGNVYLTAFSYSSSTGFMKRLMRYQNYEWQTIFSSHIVYDKTGGNLSGYDVNGYSVSETEYYKFNNSIENSIIPVSDFNLQVK